MAHQSGLTRGKSWSTGSTAGSLPSSATRWMKSERLKKLEHDARTSSSEMKTLEAEIRELATTLEKLKKFDAKRVERLRELVDDEAEANGEGDAEKIPSSEKKPDAHDGEGLNGEERTGSEEESQVERSNEREESEKVKSLRSEHKAAQDQIQYTQASLERKRAEYEALSGNHQTVTELLSKEESQAAEIDDSLLHSVAAQQEMRSLSEDLGRLGRLMEGLKESNNAADSLKPGFARPQPKSRVYHPVTQLRSRNSFRNSLQNGGGASADLSRSVSLGDPPMPSRSREPSRIKEPAEFEEREGRGNRKRHKNSSFEQERERLHEERAKLEVEAKEKRRLLESLASFSPQRPSSRGPSSDRGSSASSRESISSPLSVFEGFGLTPSLGSMGPPSTESKVSDSSESSSEFSLERRDSGALSSAVKRLDFESFANEDSVVPFDVDFPSKGTAEEEVTGNGVEHALEIMAEEKQPRLEEGEFEGGSLEGLPSENGNEEFHVPVVNSVNDAREGTAGLESFSPLSGAEEMQELEIESLPSKNAAEEILEPSEIEMVGLQGPEDMSPESGTERTKSYLEVLARESEPEETQDVTTSDEILVANFEREVVELLCAELDNAVRETETETAEQHTLPGVQKDEVEEIDIPREEFDSFRDGEEEEEEGAGEGEEVEGDVSREAEVISTRNKVEEIDVPEEDIEDFEDAEPADEISERHTLQPGRRVDKVERSVGTNREVSADSDDDDGGGDIAIEASPSSAARSRDPPENGLKSAGPSVSELGDPLEEGEVKAEEMSGERPNRRWEAENQMMQLSSQLSLLQKQVEEEVDLHENAKDGSQLEHTSAEKEQLFRQVSFFADEVRGLRQNIDEIQVILHKEGGDFSPVEHWARDLHSKCADQSAQLEHLGKQVSRLGKYLEHHLQLRVDIDEKLDNEAHERQKVEAQFTDLSKALAVSVSTMEREEEAVGELIQHQKHLLVDQLKEAEKLRHIAEVRVLTLNNQIEQLEMVCQAAKNIQAVTKYQDKTLKQGVQTIVQLFLLALGIITLYSRVAEPLRVSLIPT